MSGRPSIVEPILELARELGDLGGRVLEVVVDEGTFSQAISECRQHLDLVANMKTGELAVFACHLMTSRGPIKITKGKT